MLGKTCFFNFFSVFFVWILRVGHKIKNILYSIVPTFSAFLLTLSLKISVFFICGHQLWRSRWLHRYFLSALLRGNSHIYYIIWFIGYWLLGRHHYKWYKHQKVHITPFFTYVLQYNLCPGKRQLKYFNNRTFCA